MIQGTVEPGFESVREQFERCFTELGETGAGFAAIAEGRVVAGLWGGAGWDRDPLPGFENRPEPHNEAESDS